MAGSDVVQRIEGIGQGRVAKVGAFWGGAFGAFWGLTRGSLGGLAVAFAGTGLMLWGLRELASLQDAAGSDLVQEASEESFPASDAPSWTPTSRAGGGPLSH